MKKIKLIIISLLAILLFSFSSEAVNADSNIPPVLLNKTWKSNEYYKNNKNGETVVIKRISIFQYSSDNKFTNHSYGYWTLQKKGSTKEVHHYNMLQLLENPIFTKKAENEYLVTFKNVRYSDIKSSKMEVSTGKILITINNSKKITAYDYETNTKGYKPQVYKAE